MKAYPEAIKRGVATVMASYSSWNGVKMHANKKLLTDVLKGELGFKGFIISDWLGIDRIGTAADHISQPNIVDYAHSTELALNAGIDMVSSPSFESATHKQLTEIAIYTGVDIVLEGILQSLLQGFNLVNRTLQNSKF